MSAILLFCCVLSEYFFFFFKQKTAYEMRISDWSSDVCSSDLNEGELLIQHPLHLVGQFGPIAGTGGLRHDMLQPALRLPAFGHRLMRIFIAQIVKREADAGEEAGGFGNRLRAVAEQEIGRAACRGRVWQYV